MQVNKNSTDFRMKESLQTLGFSGISYKSYRYEQAKSEVNNQVLLGHSAQSLSLVRCLDWSQFELSVLAPDR